MISIASDAISKVSVRHVALMVAPHAHVARQQLQITFRRNPVQLLDLSIVVELTGRLTGMIECKPLTGLLAFRAMLFANQSGNELGADGGNGRLRDEIVQNPLFQEVNVGVLECCAYSETRISVKKNRFRRFKEGKSRYFYLIKR